MPKRSVDETACPADRRRQVARIFAKGVARRRVSLPLILVPLGEWASGVWVDRIRCSGGPLQSGGRAPLRVAAKRVTGTVRSRKSIHS